MNLKRRFVVREIKFRAWDENLGKMLFAEEFPICFEVDNGFFSGGFADNGDWYERSLMQFTGLIDRDGAEIFEGDILAIGDGQKTLRTVTFENAAFTSNSVHGKESCPLLFYTYSGLGRVQVIGNIHENPELLEGVAK